MRHLGDNVSRTKVRQLIVIAIPFFLGPPAHAVYDLPNNDTDCPANCRQIPWVAGSDLWNGGSLPLYTSIPCAGLTEGNGSTDNTARIQNCLNSLGPNQAALIPPGMYYVNGTITITSNKVLRGSGSANCAQGTWLTATFHGDAGAQSACTTLKLGPGGGINLGNNDVRGTPGALSGGYTKGSTAIVATSASGISVNDWIIVYENQGDTAIPVTWTGENGNCTWCGESNATGHLMSQIVQVTGVSGNTLTLSRPLFYTFKFNLNPGFRQLTFSVQKAGVESIKLWGSVNTRTAPHINMDGALFSWIKNVETYNTPDVAKAYPILMEYSYGNEVRDSYFHYGQGNSGDRNYGIGLLFSNSDHKIENNIYRENRHSFSQEGGGSGIVFLYNYIDDDYTDDLSYLGSPRSNHGAHPYATLYEGNVISHFVADDIWGSSSHQVLFRNWIWGDESGNFSAFNGTTPNWGFAAVELAWDQNFYSLVGNVLGVTGLHTNWATASVFSAACGWSSSRTTPRVYGLGCDSSGGGTYNSTVRASTILHGNYDYKTQGVAFWDGGSDHALKNSMYYVAKPAFFGSAAWPPFGPDIAGLVHPIPAQLRFSGTGIAPSGSSCDLNNDSATNVSDVQLCVNQAIGTATCLLGDINKDGVCNVIDVQRDVNSALGGQCVTQ
jgi:hypothetical protein